MIVDCCGERHQDAGHAGGAQFGQGRGPCPAHHQVGPGVGSRHVGDEGFQLRGHAGVGIGLGGFAQHLFAALVAHFELEPGQAGDHARHRLVKRARALAAAQHQHAQAGVRRCQALRGYG